MRLDIHQTNFYRNALLSSTPTFTFTNSPKKIEEKTYIKLRNCDNFGGVNLKLLVFTPNFEEIEKYRQKVIRENVDSISVKDFLNCELYAESPTPGKETICFGGETYEYVEFPILITILENSTFAYIYESDKLTSCVVVRID